MAMEMVCGNCQGRLMVEQTGIVVACPHCGAHLQIGEAPPQAPPPMYPPQDYSQPQYAPHQPPQNYPYPNYQQPYPQYYPPQPPLDPTQSPYPQGTPQFQMPAPQAEWSVQPAPPIPESRRPEPVDVQVPVPSSVPPVPVIPSPQPTEQTSPPSASDSWLPKIDLAMPEPIPSSPPPPPTPAPETVSATPIVATEPTPLPTIDVTTPPLKFEAAPVSEPATNAPTAIWNAAQMAETKPSPQPTPPPVAPTPVVAQPLAPPTTEMSHKSGGAPDFSGFGGTQFGSNQPATAIPTLEISAGQDDFAAVETTSPQTGAGRESAASNEKKSPTVSKQLFIIVLSYASAVTIGFMFLYYQKLKGSTLDLPDRAPKFDKQGKPGFSLYPDGPLPPSHRLKLGESRQFGSVRITPIKVTKGTLEFDNPNGANEFRPSPTLSPVLKLWVKFENVSKDQTFPALDDDLVYGKVRDKSNNYLTNQYVCPESERKPQGNRVTAYTRDVVLEWQMKDQKLNQELAPGDVWETYIPTNDERDLTDLLQGPLAWRVHFRKGYNRSTFRGVTTVVEVEFDSKEIQADS